MPEADILAIEDKKKADEALQLLRELFEDAIAEKPDVWKSLNPDQQAAAREIITGNKSCYILTGDAGTGKTFLLRALRTLFPSAISLCAMTGKAATLLGATTFDKLFGIDRKNLSFRSNSRTVLTAAKQIIVIDEASMLGDNLASMVKQASNQYYKRIILCGDWAQASPVDDQWPFNNRLVRDQAGFIKLRQQMRQTQDAETFICALNWLRVGECTDAVKTFFRQCQRGPVPESCVRLYAFNETVRAWNSERLKAHITSTGNAVQHLVAEYLDKRPPAKQSEYPLTAKAIDKIFDDVGIRALQEVAVGCRLLCLRNHKDLEYTNGDTGVLEGIEGTTLEVRLDRTGKCVQIGRREFEIKDGHDRVVGVVVGHPVTLGYALTIHKAQGATIPQVYVDLASIAKFPNHEGGRHGLAYVACSRVRKIEDLWLDDVEVLPHAVVCDPIVRPFLQA